MVEDTDPTDYRNNPGARQKEWFRYYSEKRIGHQWFQLHLLDGLTVQSVLEVGPNLGLVSALLVNAGFTVTTMDMLPSQDPRAQYNPHPVRPDRSRCQDAVRTGRHHLL